MLLRLLILNANRTTLNSKESKLYSEYFIAATSIAQSLISEVKERKFDRNVTNQPLNDVNTLTPPISFGVASGTPVSSFTAIEDYHNHQRTVASPCSGNFNTRVTINYVSEVNLNQNLSVRSRVKKISVFVTSPFLKDTLSLHTFKSY
ncbi:MAG TPA: hypothetical protein PK559_11490 [Ignavibacteriaceae bacterium]|nr:hypothetical protein [Ignavibacteriaceae bacterium]